MADNAHDGWQAFPLVPGKVNDPLLHALGETVRDRRRGLKLAQDDVGGVSRVFLQRIEVGGANPSIVSLSRLAQALGTTGSSLLAEAESRLRPV